MGCVMADLGYQIDYIWNQIDYIWNQLKTKQLGMLMKGLLD